MCAVEHCDFVIWTESNIAMEKIRVDKDFFQEIVDDVKHFFVYGMLLEITGKWCTRKPVANSSGIVSTTVPTSEGEVDDEDYTACWCYYKSAKLWNNDWMRKSRLHHPVVLL